jgi:flagellar basal body-associated protein FliL
MASERETPSVEEKAEAAAGSPRGSRGLLGKLKWVALVLVVVLVECVVASFWLPSVTENEAQAAATTVKVAEEQAPAEETKKTELEVDLGNYMVTSYQPLSGTTLRIDFHLYGTVSEEAHPVFSTLKEENDARLREQVNVIVRSASLADLTDPGLGLIKRRILEKINSILGKPLVKEVVISDFSFMGQ